MYINPNRDKMRELKNKGFSYGKIGKLFNLSRARVHQLISGYNSASSHNNKDYNNKLRLIIFARDEFKCQWGYLCKDKEVKIKDLVIHHIDLNDKNNKRDNLLTVCKWCHASFHAHGNGIKGKRIVERIITTCSYCKNNLELTPSAFRRHNKFCSKKCRHDFYKTPEMIEKKKILHKESMRKYYHKNKKIIAEKNKIYYKKRVVETGVLTSV
jgi:hypothetical protein